MIQFSGYGLIIVVLDYFGGIFLLSQLTPYLFIQRAVYCTLFLSYYHYDNQFLFGKVFEPRRSKPYRL